MIVTDGGLVVVVVPGFTVPTRDSPARESWILG